MSNEKKEKNNDKMLKTTSFARFRMFSGRNHVVFADAVAKKSPPGSCLIHDGERLCARAQPRNT
jgi:hypothetical protein